MGSRDIFSQVLFGWAAMGAAFGPLLIARVVLGRQGSALRSFVAMMLGAGLSVAAFYSHGDVFEDPGKHWHLFTRGVVPFFAALVVAAWPDRPEPEPVPTLESIALVK